MKPVISLYAEDAYSAKRFLFSVLVPDKACPAGQAGQGAVFHGSPLHGSQMYAEP